MLVEEGPARKRFRAEDDEEGVVTSATDVETSDAEVEEPLHPLAAEPHVGEGEMFDPFSEPPPGREAPTVHPPPMSDEPRAQLTTSPALDELVPDEAKPSGPPKIAPMKAPIIETAIEAPVDSGPVLEASVDSGPVIETGSSEAESVEPAPRVQSITSEVEEVHEFEAPKLPSVAPPVVAAMDDERLAVALARRGDDRRAARPRRVARGRGPQRRRPRRQREVSSSR